MKTCLFKLNKTNNNHKKMNIKSMDNQSFFTKFVASIQMMISKLSLLTNEKVPILE